MIKYPNEQTQYNVDENKYKQDEVKFAEYQKCSGICNTVRRCCSKGVSYAIAINNTNKSFCCY